MKRKASKRNDWEDHYTRRAKREKFPARSVYKLQEIQKKYRLIRPGNRVLDLGCAPGSWLLYAAGIVGERGQVAGIDLKPVSIALPLNALIYTGDILHPGEELKDSLGKSYHVVLSDMAPNTTGNKAVDAARSFDLCETALNLANEVLYPGGSFVCKIFQGERFREYSNRVKIYFQQQKIFKPQSSRKASKEIYILGIGKKPNSFSKISNERLGKT
jgi:23S rRNA (uridine2552-2'-O)-methyltransferase